MRARILIAAVAAALIVPATSAATTEPSKKVTLVVILNDNGTKVAGFTQMGQGPSTTLNPLMGPVPRGDWVSINIFNRGKKAHDFTIFGKKTPKVKPGGKAHLFVAVMKRGKFPYGSTIDDGKAFRGFVVVGDAGDPSAMANPA